jgi:ribosome recycling factor
MLSRKAIVTYNSSMKNIVQQWRRRPRTNSPNHSSLWKNCGLDPISVMDGGTIATLVQRKDATNIQSYQYHNVTTYTTAILSTRTGWTMPSSSLSSSSSSSSYRTFSSMSGVNTNNNNIITNVVRSSGCCGTNPSPLFRGVIRRWKNSSKVGHRLNALDEMAHRPEREAAQERRTKKKEKKVGSKKTTASTTTKTGGNSSTNSKEEDNDNKNMVDNHYVADDDLEEDDDDEDDGSAADGSDNGDGEAILPNPHKIKEKMMSMVHRFQESLKSIRGAEPTAEIFDDVQVNAYGSMTPLKAVGQVVIVSPTLATIACFDPALARDVQKAVQLTLELNPQLEESGMVRVPLPRVSMEVREQTTKQLHKMAEACKQRVRQVRRRAMDSVKKGMDGKMAGISKDEAYSVGKEIDQVMDTVMDTLKGTVESKVKSIMVV